MIANAELTYLQTVPSRLWSIEKQLTRIADALESIAKKPMHT